MKGYLTVCAVLVFVCVSFGTPFGLYDDFSTENNSNWTVDEGVSGMIDLHAYAGKKDEYPYNGSVLYREGQVAYRSSGGSGPFAMMKTSLDDANGASAYHIAFDLKFHEDWSSSWSERVFVGDKSSGKYLYIEVFGDNKSRDGKRYFVGLNDGSGEVDKYSSLPANPKDWYHYEIMIENGNATVKRWDMGYRRNDSPHGDASQPYVPSGAPTDEVSFAFSLPTSGNELIFQSYGKSQETLLDDVYLGVPEPATIGLVSLGVFGLLFKHK